MKPLSDKFIHLSADMVESFWTHFDEMQEIDQQTAVGVWLHLTMQFFGVMNPSMREGYYEIMGTVIRRMNGVAFEDLLDVTTFINTMNVEDLVSYTWASSVCPCPDCVRKNNETKNNAI